MTWDNLLRNCCPTCGGDLQAKKFGSECSFKLCTFFIREAKLTELKDKLRQQDFGSRLSNARRQRATQAQ